MTSSRTVLVVDDSNFDRQLAIAALAVADSSCRAVALEDGIELLDYLTGRGNYRDRPAETPALVLLDMRMPRADGLEVLRQLKHDPALRPIPTVIFSSSRLEDEVRQSYELGANAYVVKPIESGQFFAAIRDIAAFWLHRNEPVPPTAVSLAAPEDASPPTS